MRRPIATAAAAIFLAAFYLLLFAPLIVVVGASFDGTTAGFLNFPPHHPSLRWYFAIPPEYLHALGVSCALGGASAAISGALGVAAALGLVRGTMRGKPAIAALLRAPLQIPAVVVGLGFLQFYYLLGAGTNLFLQQTFTGLLLGHVFITLPFVIAPVEAVLQRFSASLEEAAISLGASRWRTFRRVTLPVIMPGVWSGALYAFIVSFGDVPVSLFLAGQRTTPFPVAMFNAMQFNFNPSILAISTLVLLGSCVVVWGLQRLLGLDALGATAQ